MKSNKGIHYDLLKSLLDNPVDGPKKHIISDCPHCGKPDHFYINSVSGLWDCKKCKENGNLDQLLYFLGRIDLIDNFQPDVDVYDIKGKLFESEEEDDLNVPDIKLNDLQIRLKKNEDVFESAKFKPIKKSNYLQSRGFGDIDFEFYKIGKISHWKMNGYLFFLICEGDKPKGYLGRWSLKRPNKIKYRNSETDFSKLLMGFDEIEDNTKTVILVEGIFDKINIDRHLELQKNSSIKCLVTFGKSISDKQLLKLRKTNIMKIILFYDPDAIKEIKKYVSSISNYFEVWVAFSYDKDAGDLNKKELFKVLSNLEKPIDFALNKMRQTKL